MDRSDYDEKIALLKEFCKTSVKGVGKFGFIRNHTPRQWLAGI